MSWGKGKLHSFQEKVKERFKVVFDWFSIDVETPFYRQRAFYWAVGIPLVLFFLAILGLVCGPEKMFSRSIQIDAEGYAELTRLLTFPFYLITGTTILGVMVARFHRSKQTIYATKVAEKKADFDRLFKHREEFANFASMMEKEFDDIDLWIKHVGTYRVTPKFINSGRLYAHYFPGNTTTVGDELFVGEGRLLACISNLKCEIAAETAKEKMIEYCLVSDAAEFLLGLRLEIYEHQDPGGFKKIDGAPQSYIDREEAEELVNALARCSLRLSGFMSEEEIQATTDASLGRELGLFVLPFAR